MNTRTFKFIFFLYMCICWGTKETLAAPTDSLFQKVQGFGLGIPQEKVYLHIDNTCYFLGDTIWYKGYVTRSDRGTLTDLSKILYVELLTPDGYSVERQQLEMKDGTVNGAFVLTDSLYAGYYELRAYTRWMLNFGQCEYPHISNKRSNFYSRKMKDEYFRDFEKLYSRVFPVYDKPQEKGNYIKNMTLRPMRRYYKDREPKPTAVLRFYPEGGHLVQNTTGRIALELNNEDSKHLEQVDITITDHNGTKVSECKTDKRGRASFVLNNISPKEKYKALFTLEGVKFSENLPEVETNGCAISVIQNDSTAEVTIQAEGINWEIALHIMHQGVSKFYLPLEKNAKGEYGTVNIPLRTLPTGVNQLTLFDEDGRIYADRLFFVNHHDYDSPQIKISGIETLYEPFDSITLRLKLTDTDQQGRSVSLSIRDRETEEMTYDNGTMLTEMLLASEIRGFVENPGYYFESDDSLHRHALDLLLMIQGWRRYEWRIMADVEPFNPAWLPEKFQTIAGCVNHAEQKNIDFKKASNLKKEVNVWAMFVQNEQTIELKQPTKNGTFYMQTPKIYGEYMLFLSAAGLDKGTDYIIKSRQKDFTDEEAWPEYYVKMDLFYPHFAKPYNYYQDTPRKDMPLFEKEDSIIPSSFTNRYMPTVTVQAKKVKRGGLRKYDPTKPAIVIDAYEAYNLLADYGLSDRPFYHMGDSVYKLLAELFVGDMNMHRQYDIEKRYDGKLTNIRSKFSFVESPFEQIKHEDSAAQLLKEQKNIKEEVSYAYAIPPEVINIPEINIGGYQKRKKYSLLSWLDKFYVYTDYVPREQGSWKYEQANQPQVIIDYRLYPNDQYFPACRDRRYWLKGYAVCEEFYSPDYSRKPLPETKDYRRTLLWIPEVQFDENGEATVRLFNNSKKTAISVEAEGITGKGIPVTWNSRTKGF